MMRNDGFRRALNGEASFRKAVNGAMGDPIWCLQVLCGEPVGFPQEQALLHGQPFSKDSSLFLMPVWCGGAGATGVFFTKEGAITASMLRLEGLVAS